MILNLPKWYRPAAIDSINEETLKKRSSAIETIINTNNLAFLLDCIRCYLNKPVKSKEFDNEFFKAFNATDGMYLDDTRDLEKRVLAGAIVSGSINKNNSNSLTIATVLKSAIFGITENILNIDIIQNAIDFLEDQAITARKVTSPNFTQTKYPKLPTEPQTIESFSTHLKNLGTYFKDVAENMEKQNIALSNRLAVLEEESNIHWWLFRSFSIIKDKDVSKLNPAEAPFILAIELVEFYKKLPIPGNSRAFLNKILSDIPQLEESISIKKATEIITSGLKGIIKDHGTETYGNLTPLNFAYSKAIEAGGDEAWTSIFKIQTGIQSDYSCSPLDISMQFLHEMLLYKL